MLDGLLRSASSLHTSVAPERLAGVMKAMALGGVLALGAERPAAIASV
jgi:hypothetical protein